MLSMNSDYPYADRAGPACIGIEIIRLGEGGQILHFFFQWRVIIRRVSSLQATVMSLQRIQDKNVHPTNASVPIHTCHPTPPQSKDRDLTHTFMLIPASMSGKKDYCISGVW